ncbi:alkaline phosphatase family protein [Bowmanella sp. Y26]|uniref:alkaline phosphatase family protein n=1 Tax=Bowmanella yangjiangensis TaxID=2811230 RepID=UPI001BDBC827|nr:alkaline phosphatase family protein [Bowmanella yangjiangensis]MBT1062383.1 alkaline phosphatase family protein [Bowmanella yangjiangensis]
MNNAIRLLALCACFSAPAFADSPKLIVQITVDQLRGDLLHKYQSNFLDKRNQKGFKRFLDDGTLYTNAHYRHATTLTAVGHATLATGALPTEHGILSNGWVDRDSGEKIYCVADKNTQLLGADGYSASPANLMASTFSDELYQASNGKAKIYAVSTKDRGAVLTGGHFGKAFWFDKNNGNVVTSNYYFDSLPDYAVKFNESGLKDSFAGTSWTLSQEEANYHNDASNRPFQIPPKGFRSGFPHQMPETADKAYYGLLAYTPFGDKLTAEFAKQLVKQADMGKDDITDYLSVSFSTNDYVGHMFGPNSLEAEDNLMNLDRTLADFFSFLDKQVGLDNVLIALSADHGVDSIPEYKKSIGFAGFRGNTGKQFEAINQELAEQFGIEGKLVSRTSMPFLYLDLALIEQNKLDIHAVQLAVAKHAATLPGIARVFTRKQLMTEDLSFDPIGSKVQRAYVPSRAGDVVLVQSPSSMFEGYSAATHGSPYKYDTHVPVFFTGWKVKPRSISRQVSPEDVAVTLSALMKITYPDKSTGQPLDEVVSLAK